MNRFHQLFFLLLMAAWSGIQGGLCAAQAPPDLWRIGPDGAALCEWKGPSAPGCQLDLHGQGVMLHLELPASEGEVRMVLGWPILRGRDDLRGGIVRIARKDWPQLMLNGAPCSPGLRENYRYDGIFTVQYRSPQGVQISCAFFPSVTRRAAIEEWSIVNSQAVPVTIAVASARQTLATPTNALHEPSVLERVVRGLASRPLPPGQQATWTIVHTLRKSSEPELAIDVAAEKAARLALFRKAREPWSCKRRNRS